MTTPFSSLSFQRGPTVANRFMLAPLTNQQSHTDGTLSDEEHHWLTMRAKGGFGITMTTEYTQKLDLEHHQQEALTGLSVQQMSVPCHLLLSYRSL
jgi:2,4-dienoyl-CoA reductase-like NADH-dependent reductase (Old Yellow Enzyme family)